MTESNKRIKGGRSKFGQQGARTRATRNETRETMFLRPRLLIVCEGAKTEPNYFLAFKVTNEVYGKGLNTLSLISEAERRNREDGPFDQIWCVFDRDSFPADDFNRAITLAESKKFRVAYSNEAFELWYLLHFRYVDTALHRSQYAEKLEECLERKYKKHDSEIFELLQAKGDEAQAIRFAERLRLRHPRGFSFSNRNPETTVDLLVQELRRIRQQRGY